MAIKVRFDKAGFYHPAFGRLGRGDANRGRIYQLPDQFAERETYQVKNNKTGEVVREIERYKFLPSTAEIIDDVRLEELKEEALEADEPEPKVTRPKIADEDELNKITGRGSERKPQSAQERTTGRKTTRRKPATS